ncbi:RNA methyltransferase [Stutzerimonas kirkiae]|uniref:RNA methyltransferase n=1 Tax=Stutzerimonas kirkiae TaxID=2211392 RepID=A0A4Q9R801_9GAMM|nr:RNA methyltransferase [Stutzerimonas kirkiae]TBU96047.1 RNA methyltransferase [Stutzerimonas kirkiae]TBV03121.1 RNA methyltransferase [Stutzerimonas kirkiae]TBV09795.1 RNA methyltransferase [Stutzerimonas kirkiae]TBV13475.1 RNA methyltransferase [Stutzerimonas kirkiae]
MHIADIYQQFSRAGAKAVHSQRLMRMWLQGLPPGSGTRRQKSEDFLPLGVRQALPELEAILRRLARIHAQHPDGDGSNRLLVALADGQLVESVLLPRGGLCVSSQLGCAVGCVFCMTGRSGLLRQLGSAEIVAQVALARSLRSVNKVVFMGMGEPAHNLDNVLEAIDLLGTVGGIGHKQLVFSSVGDLRVFERLPRQQVKPALALSLHSTDASLRQRLLPKAPRIPPAELVEHAEAYARNGGYPIQYQWTLLAGINDSQEEMDALIRLLKGKFAILNVIPYNSLENDQFQRPTAERTRQIMRYLHGHGILTKIRDSAGQEVDGGCGQLRARAYGSGTPEA